jgi:hypothetical protein
MKKIIALGLAVIVLNAYPVMAEEGSSPEKKGGERPYKSRMFEENDTDKDGKISKQEYLAGSEKRFAEIDANKDNFLTMEEMKARRDEMRAKMKERRKERAEKKAEMNKADPASPETKKPE